MNTNEKVQKEGVIAMLRTHLEEQLHSLEHYLDVLEKQEQAIHAGHTEGIAACVQHNHVLSLRMQDVHKVILPLQELYADICPEEHESIAELHTCVQSLCKKVHIHSNYLIDQMQHMANNIQEEIQMLPHSPNNPFAVSTQYLDITV